MSTGAVGSRENVLAAVGLAFLCGLRSNDVSGKFNVDRCYFDSDDCVKRVAGLSQIKDGLSGAGGGLVCGHAGVCGKDVDGASSSQIDGVGGFVDICGAGINTLCESVGARSLLSTESIGCERPKELRDNGGSVKNFDQIDGKDNGCVSSVSRKDSVPGAFGNSRHEKGSCGNAGSGVGHGPNWERNKKNRADQKARKIRRKELQGKLNEIGKKRGVVSDAGEDKSPFSLSSLVRDQNVELRNSLAAKWKAENALAKLRAERQFAVLSASDLQDEVKQHRTKLNATIERNMVSIEKTHATLRATGNVAGEFHGSAETILTPDLSSGSISPGSSASMQEFRAVQKKSLDQEKKIEDLERKLALVTEKTGVSGPYIDLYDQDFWTNNSVNNAILDEMYPNGYGMDGSYCNDGKVRVIPM